MERRCVILTTSAKPRVKWLLLRSISISYDVAHRAKRIKKHERSVFHASAYEGQFPFRDNQQLGRYGRLSFVPNINNIFHAIHGEKKQQTKGSV